MTLRYKDVILSSTEEVLRRVGVSRTFGPTYPGDDLRYPGLWFGFEEDGIGEGLKGTRSEDRMQEVKRVLISQKGNDGKDQDALDEVDECPTMHGDIRQAVVKVLSESPPPNLAYFLIFRFMMALLFTFILPQLHQYTYDLERQLRRI